MTSWPAALPYGSAINLLTPQALLRPPLGPRQLQLMLDCAHLHTLHTPTGTWPFALSHPHKHRKLRPELGHLLQGRANRSVLLGTFHRKQRHPLSLPFPYPPGPVEEAEAGGWNEGEELYHLPCAL